MQELTLDINDYEFKNKIKFYYSLLFVSATDILKLENNFGKNIDVFQTQSLTLPITEYYAMTSVFQKIQKIYNQIDLTDEEILRLFQPAEIKNNFKSFLKKTFNKFDYDSKKDIEKFLYDTILEKVRNRVQYGTLFDFFKTCSEKEVNDAIDNFDYKTLREFNKRFGKLKIDKTGYYNDSVKISMLIEMYNYILRNREKIDVISIIKSFDQNVTLNQMYLFDYIRKISGNTSLEDDYIIGILSKLDYSSIVFLKKTYGLDYREKGVPDDAKRFDLVINKIKTIMNGTLEDSQKTKNKNSKMQNRTKTEKPVKHYANPDELLNNYLKENNITRKEFDEVLLSSSLTKNQKECIKMHFGIGYDAPMSYDEIAIRLGKRYDSVYHTISTTKKKIIKLIKLNKEKLENPDSHLDAKKRKNRRHVKKRLNKFLNKNNITKEEFDRVLPLLDEKQKECIELYFGLNNDFEMSKDEIVEKLNITRDEVQNNINNAKKRILELIEINKDILMDKDAILKTENESEIDGYDLENRLERFLTENNITRDEFDLVLPILPTKMQKYIKMYFGVEDYSPMWVRDIAKKEGKSISNISTTISKGKTRILELIKEKREDGTIFDSKPNEFNSKVYTLFKKLLKKEKFKNLVDTTSPLGAVALSLVANFGFVPSKLSEALLMNVNDVIKLLIDVSIVWQNYIKDPENIKDLDFSDEDIKLLSDTTYLNKRS